MNGNRNDNACVVGLGWGDEGKGKLIDLLAGDYQIVVRYNGGANAGHTVYHDGEKIGLHLMPSGVFHEGAVGVIGPGVVVHVPTLCGEIDKIEQLGIDLSGRMKISDRAHLVMPWHIREDQLSEGSLPQDRQIGTTARGIGPCYADKMRRSSAIRVCDLRDTRTFAQKVKNIVQLRRKVLAATYDQAPDFDVDAIVAEYAALGARIEEFVCDTTTYLHRALDENKKLLFEAANGTLLDVDHGTFPFVTSSSSSSTGLAAGSGVPAQRVGRIIGATKSYSTRVGQGPFPTELDGDVADMIRRQGHEFGTTTGRPRRCGWLDAVAMRYAIRVSGATEVAVMHLDTLSGFDQVGICRAYLDHERETHEFFADPERLGSIKPAFEMLPGWGEDLRGVRRASDLPANAAAYLDRLEKLFAVPIRIVGVGPERDQVLTR